jgi:3-hydroxybutyryl-CoA dehydrogenase
MMDRHEIVGVIGAGLMGTEIALVFAHAGFQVMLTDTTEENLVRSRERMKAIHDKDVSRGLLLPEDSVAAIANVRTTLDTEQLSACHFVVEAVFERAEAKVGVLREMDRICQESCIIATNTSTIPISILASHLTPQRKPRFIGTHFFSPVTRMSLVEIISGFETAPDTKDVAMRLCRAIGKVPVTVKDVPGFAVNRLLHAFLIEAVRLIEEEVASPEDIDTACRLALGHPLGPFELMDRTTSSLCLQSQEIMFEAYGERFRPRQLLKSRVKAGLVGGRNKPGWRHRSSQAPS